MQDDTGEPAVPSSNEYMVIFRLASDAIFLREDQHITLPIQSQVGSVILIFRTDFRDEGHHAPVPRGLLLDARGQATSLQNVIAGLGMVGGFFADALAVAANATIGEVEPYIALDNTDGHDRREFSQWYFPPAYGPPTINRQINVDATTDFLVSLARLNTTLVAEAGDEQGQSEAEQFGRAISQYSRALLNWRPGRDLLAIEHLWIATEVLTPLIRKWIIRREAMTEKELAVAVGISEHVYDGFRSGRERNNAINGAVRRSIIFENDRECYIAVKDASDGFEHGYASFLDSYANGEPMRDRAAKYIRSAILDYIGITAETRAALLAPPYHEPVPWPKTRRLSAIVGSVDVRQPTDFPRVRWDRPLKAFFRKSDGEYTVLAPDLLPGNAQIQDELGGVAVYYQGIYDEDA